MQPIGKMITILPVHDEMLTKLKERMSWLSTPTTDSDVIREAIVVLYKQEFGENAAAPGERSTD